MGIAAFKQKDHEEDVAVFEATVFTEANTAYRFCYCVLLNEQLARSCVEKAYRTLAPNIRRLQEDDQEMSQILAECWRIIKGDLQDVDLHAKDRVSELFRSLSCEERVALLSVDVMGLHHKEAAGLFGFDIVQFKKNLANARLYLMQSVFQE